MEGNVCESCGVNPAMEGDKYCADCKGRMEKEGGERPMGGEEESM